MRQYNIGNNLIHVIQRLYERATSAVFIWQYWRLVPHYSMPDVLEEHKGTISIAGRTITNLRFADDIDGLAGSEQELAQLVESIDQTSRAYGMEINAEKTKLMTNNINGIHKEIKASGEKLQTVLQIPGSHHIGCRIQSRNFIKNCPMHYHNDTTQANMERSEHHTRIQSQTNADPHHIHPLLRLRDLDTNNRITEEMRCYRRLLHIIIQRSHHK